MLEKIQSPKEFFRKKKRIVIFSSRTCFEPLLVQQLQLTQLKIFHKSILSNSLVIHTAIKVLLNLDHYIRKTPYIFDICMKWEKIAQTNVNSTCYMKLF